VYILLIKMTSIGDLIHALPALTDASIACPSLKVHWVIDTHFQEIATWHQAVDRIFTTNHRKWRTRPFSAFQPIRSLISEIRQREYDFVIDGQGNFKSSLLSTFAKGLRVGFDKHSLREPIAHFAYHKKYCSSLNIHAIDRLRQLFSLVLGYPCPNTIPDFGIRQTHFNIPLSLDLPESYVVFVPNTGWATKLWPTSHWKKLIQKTIDRGLTIFLPAGTTKEKMEMQQLAADRSQVKVLSSLSLSNIGYVLAHAKACICVDTGFSHLAGALGTPCVTIYGATDPKLIGTKGEKQIYLQSFLPCVPCRKKQCRITDCDTSPPCLSQITPETVVEKLISLLSKASI